MYIFLDNFRRTLPISVDLEIVSIQFVGKAPHSRGHNNPKLFEKPTDPIGVEDCICYQTSYSQGFKYFHIELGLMSQIAIKHPQNIKKI